MNNQHSDEDGRRNNRYYDNQPQQGNDERYEKYPSPQQHNISQQNRKYDQNDNSQHYNNMYSPDNHYNQNRSQYQQQYNQRRQENQQNHVQNRQEHLQQQFAPQPPPQEASHNSQSEITEDQTQQKALQEAQQKTIMEEYKARQLAEQQAISKPKGLTTINVMPTISREDEEKVEEKATATEYNEDAIDTANSNTEQAPIEKPKTPEEIQIEAKQKEISRKAIEDKKQMDDVKELLVQVAKKYPPGTWVDFKLWFLSIFSSSYQAKRDAREAKTPQAMLNFSSSKAFKILSIKKAKEVKKAAEKIKPKSKGSSDPSKIPTTSPAAQAQQQLIGKSAAMAERERHGAPAQNHVAAVQASQQQANNHQSQK